VRAATKISVQPTPAEKKQEMQANQDATADDKERKNLIGF
jgi:hypothetical protein